ARLARARASRRGATVAAAGVAAAVLWRTGLPWFDADALAARLREAGPIGPIALFALFVLQCVVAPIPSEPLMIAAGFVYGPGPGFGLAWGGVVVGALACFGLARLFGRPMALRLVRSHHLDALAAYAAD